MVNNGWTKREKECEEKDKKERIAKLKMVSGKYKEHRLSIHEVVYVSVESLPRGARLRSTSERDTKTEPAI